MKHPPFSRIFASLSAAYPRHAFVEVNGKDPYRILISCLLSLRTQDSITLPATQRLFAAFVNVEAMAKAKVKKIEQLIYPVGFYRTKARSIVAISQRLLREFAGLVPATLPSLLTFKGVGRKTANLVLSLGFQLPAICVDTHVHRISNRLGWVKSTTPEKTETQLMQFLPKRYWILINSLFVNHGQQCCRPIKPQCHRCPIRQHCQYFLKKQNVLPKEA